MSTQTPEKFSEGTIDFTYQGETFQTYYKLFGDLQRPKPNQDQTQTQNLTSEPTSDPLVVLHGGPGLCHDYLASFADLSLAHGIPVILYDQLGNGGSSHVIGKPPAFWNFELFTAELDNLLTFLGIQEGFNLAGHSWGGVLALEFIARQTQASKNLKRLVLSNSLPSAALWHDSTLQLMCAFPGDVQEGLQAGMGEPGKFFPALREFHLVHGCVKRPVPGEYWRAMERVFGPDGDPTVASAFVMQDWSFVDRLSLVKVPTLVINGEKDIAQDFVIQPFLENIPDVRWIKFEHSSHSPFIEEREEYMKAVAEFLLA